MAIVELEKTFIEFLENTPEALVKLLTILEEFIKIQGEIKLPIITSTSEKPRCQRPGDDVEVNVEPLSTDLLMSIKNGMADARVKEDAINRLKALIAGVMLVI